MQWKISNLLHEQQQDPNRKIGAKWLLGYSLLKVALPGCSSRLFFQHSLPYLHVEEVPE